MTFLSAENILATLTATHIFALIAAWNAMLAKHHSIVMAGKFYPLI
jgi:hypothetical protein